MSSREYSDYGAAPTVSTEKWAQFATQKLTRGYALIVSNDRRTANFYMRGKGYEMCAYRVALQLIRNGIVTKAGEHPLGTLYMISQATAEAVRPPKQAPPPPPPAPAVDLDAEDEDGVQEDNIDDVLSGMIEEDEEASDDEPDAAWA